MNGIRTTISAFIVDILSATLIAIVYIIMYQTAPIRSTIPDIIGPASRNVIVLNGKTNKAGTNAYPYSCRTLE